METEQPAENANSVAADNSQFLTFTLQSEEYGIEILKVQEIKGFSKITPIPTAPHYIKGVLNLRGTVVPVVDLRTRFSMTEKQYDKFTVIIVVNLGAKVVGLLVDTVSDVLDIPDKDIEDTPDLAGSVDASCITGMGKIEDRIVMLLDIARLVGVEELANLETVAA